MKRRGYSFRRTGRWPATVLSTLVALAAGVPSASSQGVAGGLSTHANALPAQLARSLAELHLTACASMMQQASDFLFEGGAGNFTIQPLGPNANFWPTVVTIETVVGEQTRFATLIVAPSGSCSGSYQQVIYWPQPCATLKVGAFAAFKGEQMLFKNVRVSEANQGLQLYLMTAGAGCVSIKKELIH